MDLDLVTRLAAVALITRGILSLVGYPFFISKPITKTYSAGLYLLDAVMATAMIIAAGRVLGWW